MSPILQNHYVLAVHDIRRSAEFYVQMLGFRIVNEPPGWIFVQKDNCLIMLGECPDDLPPADLGCHNYFAYLRVADADEYYNDLKAKGADLRPPHRRQTLAHARIRPPHHRRPPHHDWPLVEQVVLDVKFTSPST